MTRPGSMPWWRRTSAPRRKAARCCWRSPLLVLRVLALTGVDHVIPNFASLEEALAQTSANGNGGPAGAENSEQKGLIAELGTRGLDEQAG